MKIFRKAICFGKNLQWTILIIIIIKQKSNEIVGITNQKKSSNLATKLEDFPLVVMKLLSYCISAPKAVTQKLDDNQIF